jgi:hypothetical protein
MFRRFLFSRIWASAQDHAVLALLLNLLVFSFPSDRICQMEMICIGGVPVKNSFSAGPDLNYFYMIHRGGRLKPAWFTIVGTIHAFSNKGVPGSLGTIPGTLVSSLEGSKLHEGGGEGGSWIRPQHAGSKPHGTRGAIPPSSSFKGGDPKWDCTRLLALPWILYCLKPGGTFSFCL